MGLLAEAYHNELVRRIVSYFTGVATLLGGVSLASPDALTGLDLWVWLAGCGLTIIAALAMSIPRGSQTYTHEQGGWTIELVRGDLLEVSTGVVVTGDRNASTDITLVGESSLVGQVIQRWYGGENAALTSEVQKAITSLGRQESPIPLGMLIPFGTSVSRSAFLFCLAERTSTGPRTEWRDLSLAYARLWDNLRDKHLPVVTCPIIGAGFAGTTLSARGTLTFLLLGFHGVSLERRVTPRLRVVISEKDFDPRMYRSTRAMLSELGYRRQ